MSSFKSNPSQKAINNVQVMSEEEVLNQRQQICNSFGIEFQYANIMELSEPDDSAIFNIFGRTYEGYKTLRGSEPKEFDDTLNFKCDILRRYDDEYGQSVIVLIQDIPCFDSWDYMVDSYHSLYFFHSGNDIAALYCQEGYQISKIYVFESIRETDEQLKSILKDNDFPI